MPKLYDPLGILALVVVIAKMFVQILLLAKLNWDRPPPFELRKTWIKFRNNLQALEMIDISQWLGITIQDIHLGNTSANGKSYTSLIPAKSRIVPLNEMTFRRLELSAAQLLCIIMN